MHTLAAPVKTRRDAPFSIRLAPEDRARLIEAANGLPLATYIKSLVLDGSSRRSRRIIKSCDPRLLAQLLAKLGASQLSGSLADLADAVRSGSFAFDEEARASIERACADMSAMRLLLMRALGLRPDDDAEPVALLTPAFNAEAGEDRS